MKVLKHVEAKHVMQAVVCIGNNAMEFDRDSDDRNIGQQP